MFTPRLDRRADERRIRRVCSVVSRGTATVYRTPALADRDALWFIERGFVEVQPLVMLRRDTSPFVTHADDSALSQLSWRKLSARRNDAITAELLLLDEMAFPAPWHLTKESFGRACHATDAHVVVVAANSPAPRRHDGEVAGFALVGRTAQSAYLQRLAVHPLNRRCGIAGQLVRECLAWAHATGANDLYVNTEPSNEPALSLYRSRGFVTVPERLRVLERETSR